MHALLGLAIDISPTETHTSNQRHSYLAYRSQLYKLTDCQNVFHQKMLAYMKGYRHHFLMINVLHAYN